MQHLFNCLFIWRNIFFKFWSLLTFSLFLPFSLSLTVSLLYLSSSLCLLNSLALLLTSHTPSFFSPTLSTKIGEKSESELLAFHLSPHFYPLSFLFRGIPLLSSSFSLSLSHTISLYFSFSFPLSPSVSFYRSFKTLTYSLQAPCSQLRAFLLSLSSFSSPPPLI